MKNELKELLDKLSKNEIKEIIKYLTDLLLLNQEATCEEMKCPKCSKSKYIKFGFNGVNQRYKCICGKTFSSNYNSLFYYSKLSKEKIISFINYELSNLTLNEISFYLKANIATCFRLRHKLYSICEKYVDKIKLNGTVEIDSAYTNINLKGTKKEKMPRKSSKRGNTSYFSGGINSGTICIVVAADENYNYYMRIAGLGSESFEKYKKFSKVFDNAKLLVSDSKQSIGLFANHIHTAHDPIKASVTRDIYETDKGNNIQMVNEFCKCIKDIIRRYHGVSTRHLNGYIAFQTVKKIFTYKYNRESIANEIIKISNRERCIKTTDICSIDYPIDLKDAYWNFNYGIFAH